jgi:hypothetical protein
MLMHKYLGVGLLATGLLLSLACGGGGDSKSGTSAPVTMTTVSGVMDFDTGLSKARRTSSLSGNVVLVNLDTKAETIVTFAGNTTFSATVTPGDYNIKASRDDGKALRAYVRASLINDDLAIDIDSTTVAAWIDIYASSDLSKLSSVQSVVRDSRTILLNDNGYDDAQRTSALLAESLKLKIKTETVSSNILNTTYSSNAVLNQVNSVLTLLTGSTNTITLAGSHIITDSTGAQNFNAAEINTSLTSSLAQSTISLHEKMIVTASDYVSASISSIETKTLTVKKDQKTYSASDIAVIGYDRHVYTIGRYNADFIDRFDADNLGTSLYSAPYSTLSSTETKSFNPQEIIFQSKSRALITRLGSGVQWIVNPRASSSASFLLQTVDLSHYAESSDGVPEINSGIYAKGQYFLTAQRLENYLPSSNAYVVVLNGTDGSEVSTGKASASDNLKGIVLPARNPKNIVYSEATGLLYVTCVGQYGATWSNSPRQFTGGIVTIDPTTYSTNLLIDDDASNESTTTLTGGGLYGGLFSDLAIVSATKGYLVVYSAWGSSSLRSFNPTSGAVGAVIAGFEAADVKQLSVDSQNRLWVLVGTEVKIMNTSTDTVTNTISGFTYPPIGISHIQY